MHATFYPVCVCTRARSWGSLGRIQEQHRKHLSAMRKRARSNSGQEWRYGQERLAEREGTEGGIPFRTPFCLLSFPSHVRHQVYNSFLVTPMGLRHGLCASSRGSTSRGLCFGARAGWKKYRFWNTYGEYQVRGRCIFHRCILILFSGVEPLWIRRFNQKSLIKFNAGLGVIVRNRRVSLNENILE